MKLPECREQEKSLVKRQQGLADQGNGGGGQVEGAGGEVKRAQYYVSMCFSTLNSPG